MKKDLKIIKEQEVLGKEFKVYGTFESPLFLAKDVAEWIDYAKTGNGKYDVSKMLNSIDEEEKLIRKLFVSGQNREMWFVTEDGLYEILMQSRKPIAKAFKKEVKAILKSIRKHGAYMTPQKIEEVLLNPDTIIQLATALKQEQTKNKELIEENKELIISNEEMKPKATYYDMILQNKSLINTTQIAKDYGYSAAKFNELLYKFKIQYKKGKRWFLYAKYQNEGYTSSKTNYIEKNDIVITQMYWTQKGRVFLYNFLKDDGILPMIER